MLYLDIWDNTTEVKYTFWYFLGVQYRSCSLRRKCYPEYYILSVCLCETSHTVTRQNVYEVNVKMAIGMSPAALFLLLSILRLFLQCVNINKLLFQYVTYLNEICYSFIQFKETLLNTSLGQRET